MRQSLETDGSYPTVAAHVSRPAWLESQRPACEHGICQLLASPTPRLTVRDSTTDDCSFGVTRQYRRATRLLAALFHYGNDSAAARRSRHHRSSSSSSGDEHDANHRRSQRDCYLLLIGHRFEFDSLDVGSGNGIFTEVTSN